MADNKDEAKKPTKKTETVRERAAKGQTDKPRRIRKTAGKVVTPIKSIRKVGKKEYHLPLPDNKVGRILKKRVKLMPKFVREAWAEIKLVTWPNRHDTMHLTLAVFIFAVIFAVIVGFLDFGLDKLFKKVILN